MISKFPNPLTADESGIVAVGDDYSTETLLDAYLHGIFPWPQPGYPLLWFAPIERGILEFQNLHISKSLKKFMNKSEYRLTLNQSFSKVIDHCAKVPRKDQSGTWINSEIKKAYQKFHKEGHSHSFELWEESTLVAGLYGVYVQGVFSGESIFGLKDNVSKVCFVKVVEFLKDRGLYWMDVQMVTPFTKSFGASLISNKDYLKKLKKSHEQVISRVLSKSLE